MNVPRLHRTGFFGPSEVVAGSVANQDLSRPITFVTKVDLADTGLVFRWGSSLNLSQTPTQLTLTLPQGVVTIPHPGEGEWRLALSFRPGDGAAQLWNQYESLWRTNDLTPGTWAAPAESLFVGDNVIDFLSIYTAQLPRHFDTEGELSDVGDPPDATGDFWINSTAFQFMTGFPTPLFEGDV